MLFYSSTVTYSHHDSWWPLIIGILGGLCCNAPILIGIVLYAWVSATSRSKTYEILESEHSDLLADTTHFRVRYASNARWITFLKLFAWECSGILVLQDSTLLYLTDGTRLGDTRLELPMKNARTRLIRPFWKSGPLRWIEVDLPHENHYFAPETGTTLLGSGPSVLSIHMAIQDKYGLSS